MGCFSHSERDQGDLDVARVRFLVKLLAKLRAAPDDRHHHHDRETDCSHALPNASPHVRVPLPRIYSESIGIPVFRLVFDGRAGSALESSR